MPTDKPRVTITVSKEKLVELEDYRFENKFKNQTQAILSLIDKGLSDFESEIEKAPSMPDEGKKVAEDYLSLDHWGKRVVRSVIDEEKARCESEAARPAPEVDMVYYIVPAFLTAMSAGTGQPSGSEYPDNYRLTKEPPRGTSYIAHVSGDSMAPTYHDGDLVFVHGCEEIPAGRVGVFFMDGQQWVKELGDDVLLSHNPAYPPRPMTEGIRCQGLVLGVCDESYFE